MTNKKVVTKVSCDFNQLFEVSKQLASQMLPIFVISMGKITC